MYNYEIHCYERSIGKKLRDVRLSRNISRKDIADMLGVSYQKVEDYELGVEKISAGKLFILANKLNVSISVFLISGASESNLDKTLEKLSEDKLQLKYEDIEVLSLFRSFKDKKTRNRAIDLCKELINFDSIENNEGEMN